MSSIPSEMSASSTPYRATPKALARASLAAAIGAVLVLTLFVLPAEWAIDPTGVGKALGLTRMANAEDDEETGPATAAPIEPGAASVIEVPPQTMDGIRALTALRTDRKRIVLAPHSGHEIKAHMKKGDHLVFRWTARAPVRMDMHGEPTGAKDDEFTSYWKQKDLSTAQGQFTAPFEGTHGWYWRNAGEVETSIEIETTGFYADLFEPPG